MHTIGGEMSINDPALIWFITLATWRYFRLFVNLYSFWRYKPASLPTIRTIGPKDVIIILPTISVSESDNPDFKECLTTCLVNKLARLIIITNTDFKATEVNKQLFSIRNKIQRGSSSFLSELGLTNISGVDIRVIYTRLVMFLNNYMFLPRLFLDSIIPVFENPCNIMGVLYLERHNFEIRATNARDRGVFIISGQVMVILSEIIQDNNFHKAFTNEHFFFGLFVLRHPQNYEIKIQYTNSATVETILGQYPKFLRRTPWTIWITYIPSLFNLALFWDRGILYTLTKTNFYSESRNRILLLLCFRGWIYLTKLVKLIPYFWRYPTDFFLFFFLIPAYLLFAYYYSILKLWAGIIFWNHS
ncbi:glycosyltransferase family 2 protein [Hyaloscypha bicolor E]|uniref:Glycosyltransferase family 2 protein n=1 Tax=Hyaloscypha bicolor E TaxID=1095630 RepID=A0A2J6SXJ5_9HELO|nr:glycosyltransferase family 2 protein [Hyaloscypha bicolor E]PMD55484.1 glycosyltransferase family 2 protein [Hyaloscypha bicolor E]